MRCIWRSFCTVALLLFLASLLSFSVPASSQEKTLYNFSSVDFTLTPGGNPLGGVILDASGNLYGTTSGYGADGWGAVYELIRGQGYTPKVLHSFGTGTDGAAASAGLLLDSSGNLYGTTADGGSYGLGTAFELIPTAGGRWAEKILHSFNTNEGVAPHAALIMDTAGNLYGTTYGASGINNLGSVFELRHTASGGWAFKVLHQFSGPDGSFSSAGLVLDSAGNLYGTTNQGGIQNAGTVFELSPTLSGKWIEKVLHSFSKSGGQDGCYPYGGLAFDPAGNLYGTTWECGANFGSHGAVFELTPGANGIWTETLLHTFDPSGTDGQNPFTGVVFDAAGNLYGTTNNGGVYGGGTVYALMPEAGGGWSEKVIYSFGFNNSTFDGYLPDGGVILDAARNLYGTANQGGTNGVGTVFSVKP